MNLKYNYAKALQKIVKDEFDKFGIQIDFEGLAEINLHRELNPDEIMQLQENLSAYGIEIISDQKELLVEKIKNCIIEMVQQGEVDSFYKTSFYLTEKLGYSYGYLSNTFSEVTYSTIENFIILQKIEMVKSMLMKENFSLTEAAHKLNYSSVAHLSNQFKKKVGLSPSSFLKIMEQREKINLKNNVELSRNKL
ncbi:MAG: AraC family transcriptional regulator [Cyclobacteriaceae bacterium]